ncbi:hypothetical protein [Arabidopsis thaliana]|uniref:Uncharacterized protein AT4g03640 n=1 Tax=Arabidopsis thaliana TaxID=3702 RepID=Q9SY42_ARATH|nr:hypothetical protein [Arabidopsis thaliana]CAB77849.1 hypothetical protein [Arabidopsis thaliana]
MDNTLRTPFLSIFGTIGSFVCSGFATRATWTTLSRTWLSPPYKNAWRIQVKLLHVWRQYFVKAGESIEMILVDEVGDKMSAAVRREQIKKFKRCLTEGVWKIITTVTLNPTSGHDTRLACTLWRKYAEIVDQACQKSTDGIVVCLIRYAKINLYNDNRSVSNSFDVSQVFVDSTLAELSLFKERFWLHLHIMDQTGEARCMLFDSHVNDILGTTVPELLNGLFDEIEDPTDLPDVINGLKGKLFQFLLCMQRENIFGGYDSFTVAIFYTGNIDDDIVFEDSDAYVDPSSIVSIDQVCLITLNNSNHLYLYFMVVLLKYVLYFHIGFPYAH